MAIIAVDMDDVLADTLAKVLLVYNERFGQCLTKNDVTGKPLHETLIGEHLTELRTMLSAPGFFADLAVLPGAQEHLEKLCRNHSVFIASAAMEFPTSFACKFAWLERHFPFIPASHIVFCGDKSIIHADYLVDDQPRYLKRFRGQGILFDAPHNACEKSFPRVMNWAEVDRFFNTL